MLLAISLCSLCCSAAGLYTGSCTYNQCIDLCCRLRYDLLSLDHLSPALLF